MKYAYGAESSGICVKFMPYQPVIRESGKKIVVSVHVEGGDSGGRVAAPIADKVFHAFLD